MSKIATSVLDDSARLCQASPIVVVEAENEAKKTKKQRISPLLLVGLYPPPGILPKTKLLKRGFGSDAARDGRGAGLAHNRILDRAERVHTRAVRGDRVAVYVVAAREAGRLKRVAALGATSQLRIDQASRSGRWHGRAGAAASQRAQ